MKEILEFGIKRENEERRDGGCGVVFDPKTKLFAVGKHHDGGFLRLFSGGVNENEDLREGILREVTEESGLHDFLVVEKITEALVHFHNSLKGVNRVGKAACFLVVLKSSALIDTKLEDHEKFSLYWATSDEIISNWKLFNQEHDLDHWFYFFDKSYARIEELGHNIK